MPFFLFSLELINAQKTIQGHIIQWEHCNEFPLLLQIANANVNVNAIMDCNGCANVFSALFSVNDNISRHQYTPSAII